MKCDSCQRMKCYVTGMDEYPQGQPIEYCSKGWWDASPQEREEVMGSDLWDDCVDFIPKTHSRS